MNHTQLDRLTATRRTTIAFAGLLLCAMQSWALPGAVVTWGSNANGELGDPSEVATYRSRPGHVKDPTGSGLEMSGVSAVSAHRHFLAVMSDGTVTSWGGNNDSKRGKVSGQLGTGAIESVNSVPMTVKGIGGEGVLSSVVAAATGENHSLALLMDSTVVAWGSGTEGQLGNKASKDSPYPVQVVTQNGSPLTGIVAIAGAQDFSLALDKTGAVWAWGQNQHGECGTGDHRSYNYARQVLGGDTGKPYLVGVAQITTSADHSLALLLDGTVVAWGHNSQYGEIGDGTLGVDKLAPVYVLDTTGADGTRLTGVIAISLGDEHSAAVLNDGSVVAWGSGQYGQLGDGLSGPSRRNPYPVHVEGPDGNLISDAIGLTSGHYWSAARLSDGTVYAWGSDDDATLSRPKPVGSLGQGQDVAGGHSPKALPVAGLNVGDHLHGVRKVGGAANAAWALVSTNRPIDHVVGGDGASHVLYHADGAGTNDVTLATIKTNGSGISGKLVFTAPTATPHPVQLVRGYALYVLFVDNVENPTLASVMKVGEYATDPSTAVFSAPVAINGVRRIAEYSATALYLLATDGTAGSPAQVVKITTPTVNGANLRPEPAVTLSRAAASDVPVSFTIDSLAANPYKMRVLYRTADGFTVANHTAPTAPAAASYSTFTGVGDPVGIQVSRGAGYRSMVLTATGTHAAASFTVSLINTDGSLFAQTNTPMQRIGTFIGQLSAISLARNPSVYGQGQAYEPRVLLLTNVGDAAYFSSEKRVWPYREGSGRVWTLSATTANPVYSSRAFRDLTLTAP